MVKALLPLSLLLLCCGIWAENGAGGEAQQRVCLLLRADLSAEDERRDYREFIGQLLTVELTQAGFNLVPAEERQTIQERLALGDRELVLGEKALAVASEAGADLALTGFYRLSSGRVLLQIKVYRVHDRALIASVLERGYADLTFYNLVTESVREVIEQVRAEPEPGTALGFEAERVEKDLKQYTLLSPDEGMEVYLAADHFAGRIEGGELELPPAPYEIGMELLLEKRKDGYHTHRERVELEEGLQEIPLRPLVRKNRHAGGLTWTTGQLLGSGIAYRYYLEEDVAFLGAEHYFYIQHSFREGSKALIHSDVKLLFGRYLLFGPESWFRFGLSGGLGLILTYFTSGAMPPHRDSYLSLPNIWLELSQQNWSLFIRLEGKYGLGVGRNLLGRGWLQVNDRYPPVTLGVMKKW